MLFRSVFDLLAWNRRKSAFQFPAGHQFLHLGSIDTRSEEHCCIIRITGCKSISRQVSSVHDNARVGAADLLFQIDLVARPEIELVVEHQHFGF